MRLIVKYANANPGVIRWAREAASLDLPEAARRLGVKAERLTAWETGKLQPTFNQLRALGRVYRRPSAFFYLAEPPPERGDVQDFRRLPESDEHGYTAELRFAVRRARYRREIAMTLLAELGEEVPTFGLTGTAADTAEDIARRIRDQLGVPLETQSSWTDHYAALRAWISAAERIGALVFHVSNVPPTVFRGFSLSETPLPVVAVNGKDSPRARIFTLFHELVHLALRRGGLCDFHEDTDIGGRLEAFCNQAAGEALVPTDNLLNQSSVRTHRGTEWTDAELQTLSRTYHVSREVVLRRLLTVGRTTRAFYQRKRKQYQEEAATATAQGGFLQFYRRVIRDNGQAFTSLILSAYRAEAITARDASHYLGDIKVMHLADIEGALRTDR